MISCLIRIWISSTNLVSAILIINKFCTVGPHHLCFMVSFTPCSRQTLYIYILYLPYTIVISIYVHLNFAIETGAPPSKSFSQSPMGKSPSHRGFKSLSWLVIHDSYNECEAPGRKIWWFYHVLWDLNGDFMMILWWYTMIHTISEAPGHDI